MKGTAVLFIIPFGIAAVIAGDLLESASSRHITRNTAGK